MKKYLKPDGSLHVFDENDPRDAPYIEACIADGGVEKTEEEAIAILNPPGIEVFAPLSPWQVRQVLNVANLRAAVDTLIDDGPIELQDAWHYASEFKRDNDLLNQMATSLGLTSMQVDDMFRLGATLQPQSI